MVIAYKLLSYFLGSELKLNGTPYLLFISHITPQFFPCLCVYFINLNNCSYSSFSRLNNAEKFLLIVAKHRDMN